MSSLQYGRKDCPSDHERRLFGKAGSAYDWNDPNVDMKKMAEKAKELEESQKGMAKKVNPKVVNMIDR